jgi:Mg2+/Co2+ transporter CorC
MDTSDIIIPCSQGPVVTSNRVLARVIVIISDNYQDLFLDINYSSLYSITGLLTAIKLLSYIQAQQLYLLGLLLYLAAN